MSIINNFQVLPESNLDRIVSREIAMRDLCNPLDLYDFLVFINQYKPELTGSLLYQIALDGDFTFNDIDLVVYCEPGFAFSLFVGGARIVLPNWTIEEMPVEKYPNSSEFQLIKKTINFKCEDLSIDIQFVHNVYKPMKQRADVLVCDLELYRPNQIMAKEEFKRKYKMLLRSLLNFKLQIFANM